MAIKANEERERGVGFLDSRRERKEFGQFRLEEKKKAVGSFSLRRELAKGKRKERFFFVLKRGREQIGSRLVRGKRRKVEKERGI